MIASQEGKDFSKQIGNASKAIAFAISNVDNNTWCYSIIGKIASPHFLSCSVPDLSLISKSIFSIDKYPTVNPEQQPAVKLKNKDIAFQKK